MTIRTQDKKIVGKGGMDCPCCTPRGSMPRENKAAISRRARRRNRIAIRKDN